jgi:hypothetical protein
MLQFRGFEVEKWTSHVEPHLTNARHHHYWLPSLVVWCFRRFVRVENGRDNQMLTADVDHPQPHDSQGVKGEGRTHTTSRLDEYRTPLRRRFDCQRYSTRQ